MSADHSQRGHVSRLGKIRRALVVVLIATAGTAAGIAYMVSDPYEVARIRNALIAQVGQKSDFRWPPEHPPSGFLTEHGQVPAEIGQTIAKVLDRAHVGDDSWDRTVAIARHLSQGPGRGAGIQSNTLNAYRTILHQRRGYCADYTQVFNGLAYAAGVPVREWGMSFDGYSGRGHAFSEIYDSDLKKWIFVDTFNSFYVVDRASDTPLSALELRQRLADGATTKDLEVLPIEPQRFGFKDGEHALAYYRRGANQFFLWFGNNVFSYDANPLIHTAGTLSRALEEGIGILLGLHPTIRLYPTPTNGPAIHALMVKRWIFLGLATLLAILVVALLILLRASFRAARGANEVND